MSIRRRKRVPHRLTRTRSQFIGHPNYAIVYLGTHLDLHRHSFSRPSTRWRRDDRVCTAWTAGRRDNQEARGYCPGSMVSSSRSAACSDHSQGSLCTDLQLYVEAPWQKFTWRWTRIKNSEGTGSLHAFLWCPLENQATYYRLKRSIYKLSAMITKQRNCSV